MFTAEFLSKALKISKSGSDQQFSRVWTDSRTLQAGDIFVCLKGEKFDAHDFIPEALKKGIKGFLISDSYKGTFPDDIFVLKVPDVLNAFRQIAGAWRKQFDIPVIALGGNVGKTTTKEILAALLSGRFKTAKTEKSENGFIGIPMTLLAWNKTHEAAIVEIGIDEKGAMEEHLKIVQPTQGIITAIGPEHLEKLIDIEGVIQEETRLFSWLEEKKGKVFLNLDEPLLRERAKRKKNYVTYSLEDKSADYFGRAEGQHLEILVSDHHPSPTTRHLIKLPLPLPGIHNARNLLGAAAIAFEFGLSEEEMLAGLKNFQPPVNRMAIKETNNGIHLMCDYYNANPSSMEAAFQVMESEYAQNSKILVLGDMLELGSHEESYHRGLAHSLQRLKPKSVYLLGPRMKALKDELGSRQKAAFPFLHYENKEDLASRLIQDARAGDCVLIKGSRGMRMEDIASAFS
jgi:UDP-N-acetylmuramoyl-tripeptide--D-alanyl-D-alanine ligase